MSELLFVYRQKYGVGRAGGRPPLQHYPAAEGEGGTAILYVSHRLREIFDLCDTITVLKDGRVVDTRPARELDDPALVRLMVGRPISAFFPDALPGTVPGDALLHIEEAGNDQLDSISLSLRSGEIVGLAGLQGSGRTELVEAVFGVHPFYRRLPALALARDLIGAGRVGDVWHVRVAYLQDWLADEAAPMTWRLRRETAGSGAIGDLASHAIDQIRFLLGTTVASVSGTVDTFVDSRQGPDGPESVTVDDAAWATLRLDSGAVASVEVSRYATGRKNSLLIEVFGSRGALRFDLEHLNDLAFYDATLPQAERGYSTILATEPSHPYTGSWWPPGHTLGWDHTFTSQAADFLRGVESGEAPAPSFEDALETQKALAALETSAGLGGTVVVL